jgi:hypothetical protein
MRSSSTTSRNDGSVTLDPADDSRLSLHSRYRIIVYPGDSDSAGIGKLWGDFSKRPKIP